MDRTAVADVSPTGAFARKASTFRNAFDANGAHPPEAHRYVLVVSLACPWATRCLAALHAKGLEDVLDVAVTHPVWGKTRPNDPNDAHAGWRFVKPGTVVTGPSGRGAFEADARCSATACEGAEFVRDLYEICGAPTEQRFTVPLIWDTLRKTIVNNESSEILRELNTKFQDFCSSDAAREVDLYPEHLRPKIDEINQWV